LTTFTKNRIPIAIGMNSLSKKKILFWENNTAYLG